MPPKSKRKDAAVRKSARAEEYAGLGRGNGRWWLVGFVAWLVRMIYLGQIQASPPAQMLLGDAEVYDRWAREIVAGDFLGSTVFYQSPLYPYFLAAVYSLTGGSIFAVKLLQVLFGSAACVLLGRAAERWFDRRTGLVAAWLLALQPAAVFYDGLIQKTSLELLLTTAFLLLLAKCLPTEPGPLTPGPSPARGEGSERIDGRRYAINCCALGVVLGLLAVSRENSLVWAGVVVPVLLWPSVSRSGRERVRAVALFLLGMALVIGPIAVRNRYVGGEWHLTTSQFGTNFYIGNNAQADGLYRPLRLGRGNAKYERDDAVALAEQAEGHKLGPREVSHYWYGQARAWIVEHPADWLRLLARKLRLTWYAVEVGDTEDEYAFAEVSPLLGGLQALWHFGVLAPLAAVGVVATWRRRRELWPLYALIVVYTASVVGFYVFGRYRFPLVPLLIPFAAAALGATFDALRAKHWRAVVTFAVVAAAMTAIVNWPSAEISSQRFAASSYFNFGVEYASEGKVDEAEAAYRKAVALRPIYAVAWSNLGELLHRRGRSDEALAALEEALRHNDRLAPAYNNRGVIRFDRRDLAGAEQDFRKALECDSLLADALVNLGNVAGSRGQYAAAEDHYRRALEMEPGNLLVRINLGTALQRAGRLEEAAEVQRTATQIAPDRFEAHHNLGNVLFELERYDEAESAYRQALALNPNSVQTLRSYGYLELRRGRLAEARVLLERGRTLAAAGSVEAAQFDQLLREAGGQARP